MKAIILAAGLGTRLRPMTENTPKALVKVNQKPLVEYQIEFLKEHKFEEVHFNTNVLRAETAAIYSIAAAQVIMEEKGGCKKN